MGDALLASGHGFRSAERLITINTSAALAMLPIFRQPEGRIVNGEPMFRQGPADRFTGLVDEFAGQPAFARRTRSRSDNVRPGLGGSCSRNQRRLIFFTRAGAGIGETSALHTPVPVGPTIRIEHLP